MKTNLLDLRSDYESKYGFHDPVKALVKAKPGLSREVVEMISRTKEEPKWLLDFRLRALDTFMKKPVPMWGADLSAIDFDKIIYYLKPTEKQEHSWDEVPERIRNTFERLGIPEAERKFLAGVGVQYESENVYHNVRKELAKQGVIFVSPDQALIPEKKQEIIDLGYDASFVERIQSLFRKYFSTVVPPEDNKFAALNSAVFSGGSFIYIPPGVEVAMPLQAYFRINSESFGQFERTLIIADEGSRVHYVEGCFTKGAPVVTADGSKPIEDVKVGDNVLTHALQHKTVYHTHVRPYTGPLYSIQYYGDTSEDIKVTSEHPFLAVKRQKSEYKNIAWEPEWIEAGRLEKGDYIAIPIDRTVRDEAERDFQVRIGRGRHGFRNVNLRIKTDADFFRMAGYYLAEGSIIGGHYLSFTFNEKERQFIDDVKSILERYFGKKPIENKPYKNGISIVLSSTAAARFFESQFGKGAQNKHIPKWVLHESMEKQKELIKGFWRGDGSFMMHQYSWGVKRMFRMNTVSKRLAKSIRDILLRMNIFASINVQNRHGNRKAMYCVYVGGSYLRIFAETVGAYPSNEVAVGHQVMFQMLKNINAKSYAQITESYAFVPIKSISSRNVENVPVFNFSVEDDESYVANGVIVHNCTAPVYARDSLHAAVVELVALRGAKLRYTTIQNWSGNVYNLVTKRAHAYENALVEWVDANIGSKITMKFPSVYLLGKRAKADILSVAYAGRGQHQDAGGKALHFASDTTSKIISKSVSKNGGRTSYRGLLHVAPGCKNVKSTVRCDALILDGQSRSDTYPYMEIYEEDTTVTHEATVGKIGEEKVFYLMSRGLTEAEALAMIVLGFIQEFVKELPMEYAVEMNKLIQLEMEGAVG
ncbi:MAG: SufD family Fe-S cluster assembly protein [Candidatus Aenigmarchaeota archaeon]|nr:SufD family Fe-S cluster assembly protein [Candidatus Aenigmarchaeota archaeon]